MADFRTRRRAGAGRSGGRLPHYRRAAGVARRSTGAGRPYGGGSVRQGHSRMDVSGAGSNRDVRGRRRDMTDDRTDPLDRLKAIIRRRGKPAPPTVERLVAEVRSNDVLPVQQPNAALSLYSTGSFLIEWTFGVPYKEIRTFHTFLNNNEQFI